MAGDPAGVVHASDLVEDRRHLDVVVHRGVGRAGLREMSVWKRGRDCRREEVVYAMTRGAVNQFIREMLIRPRGPAARTPDDLEEAVYSQITVAIHRRATRVNVARRLGGIYD